MPRRADYLPALGKFNTAAEAWEHRIQVGQAGNAMINGIGRLDTQRALALFGDWTDRIRKGELPFAKPPRPQGRGAQHRRHPVGLAQPHRLSA